MSSIADLLARLFGINAPPEPPAPTIIFTAPAGPVTAAPYPLTVALSDSSDVLRVDYFKGAEQIGIRSLPPYVWPAKLTPADNGQVEFRAVVVSRGGRRREVSLKADIALGLPVDTLAPTASLVASASNFTAQGTLTLICTATDDRPGPLRLRLERDGLGIPILPNGVVIEDITRASNGVHTYILFATDAAGNGGSTSRVVTINIPLPPDVTPPVIQSFTMPGHGQAGRPKPIPSNAPADQNRPLDRGLFYWRIHE